MVMSTNDLAEAKEEVARLELIANANRKLDNGERITSDERMHLMLEHAEKARRYCLGEMRATQDKNDTVVLYTQGTHNRLATAVHVIFLEMFAISAAHGDKRQALEDRVKALEAKLYPKGGA
jgi:hypothetical protein